MTSNVLKIIISTTILIFSSLAIKAQCDKLFKYSYEGEIKRKIVSDTSKINVLLPSAYHFIFNKTIKEKRLRRKRKVESFPEKAILLSKQNRYNGHYVILGPCDGNPEDHLRYLFMKNIKHYKIIFETFNRKTEVLIDIKEIKFHIENDKINIELPLIEI